MAKREFLQLAHKYGPWADVAGQFVSEKMDGLRCLWDGGVTRGMPKEDVPWANCAKTKGGISTGLWSRYGNIFNAPDDFIDQLPKEPLDGELWIPGLSRQEISSRVKGLKPTFRDVRLFAFDLPPLETVFADGNINVLHYKKRFKGIVDWLKDHGAVMNDDVTYQNAYTRLKDIWSDYVHQEQLPYSGPKARARIDEKLTEVLDSGGEGLIIRRASTFYLAGRSYNVLKYKPFDDAEGTVTGYTDGVGKLEGMMGALIVEFEGKTFKLSGFTESQRQNAETLFPIGSTVTFKYRGLSDDGIPQEARYWRKNITN